MENGRLIALEDVWKSSQTNRDWVAGELRDMLGREEGEERVRRWSQIASTQPETVPTAEQLRLVYKSLDRGDIEGAKRAGLWNLRNIRDERERADATRRVITAIQLEYPPHPQHKDYYPGKERDDLAYLLRELTRQSIGSDPVSWQNWLKSMKG